jgi:hypothetical protein
MLYGDTRYIGATGWQKLNSITLGDREAVQARKYTLRLARGNSEKRWTVIADRPHPWPLVGSDLTYDLRVGDVVAPNTQNQGYIPRGWLHGFLKRKGFTSGVLKIHPNGTVFIPRLRELAVDTYRTQEGVHVFTFPEYPWSKWPYDIQDFDPDPAYICSFIDGYCKAISDDQLSVNDETAAKWLYLHAPFAGYIASGQIIPSQKTRRVSRITETPWHTVYNFQCIPGKKHGGFKVESMQTEKIEGVPWKETEALVPVCLEGGISAYL